MKETALIAMERENSLTAYAAGLEQKLKVCEMLQKSGVLPASLKTPQAIFAITLMGQEYGFSPIKSCEMFDFIQGRACIRAAGMLALATSRGGCFVTVEESDKSCTIKAERASNKWVQSYTFTWADAEKMKLTSKENWQKMPKFMLWARCVSVLCRRGWADVLGGLYSSEEMMDSEPIDVTPVREVTPAPISAAMLPNENLGLKTADEAATSTGPTIAAIEQGTAFVYDLKQLTAAMAEMPLKEKARAWIVAQERNGAMKKDGCVYSASPVEGWEAFLIGGEPQTEQEAA